MCHDLVGALDAQNRSVPFRNLKFPYISDVAISGRVLLLGWESEARNEGIAEGCMQRPVNGALFGISDPESVSRSLETVFQGAESLTATQLIDGGARMGGCLVPWRAQVGLLRAQQAPQAGCKRQRPGAIKSRRPCSWMSGGGGRFAEGQMLVRSIARTELGDLGEVGNCTAKSDSNQADALSEGNMSGRPGNMKRSDSQLSKVTSWWMWTVETLFDEARPQTSPPPPSPQLSPTSRGHRQVKWTAPLATAT